MSRLAFCSLLILFTLVFAAGAAAGPVSDKLTPAELAQVKKGEVVVHTDLEGGAKEGYAAAFGIMRFDDVNRFWSVLSDYDGFPDFLPRVEKAVALKKEENRTWLELTINGSIKSVTYTNIYTHYPERQRNEWVLDTSRPHEPYTKNTGYWQLEEISDGVYLVEHQNAVGVDFGPMAVVANRVMAKMLKNDLPKIISNVRRRVESGGVWKMN
ncbi:MAG: SRPBCC family protein [Candidatus Lernaella stagnicola]|nr:SRPBCC family protein [Candidatus Lernaella stagnicola]